MSAIFMTILLYKTLILQGEIWRWSLLELKGLTWGLWKQLVVYFTCKQTHCDDRVNIAEWVHFYSGVVLCRLAPTGVSFSAPWVCCALSNSFNNCVASLNCVRLSSSCWQASCLCLATARLLSNAVANCSGSKLITSWRLSSENEIKNAGSVVILVRRSDEILSVSPASVRSNSKLSFLSKLAAILPWLKLGPVVQKYRWRYSASYPQVVQLSHRDIPIFIQNPLPQSWLESETQLFVWTIWKMKSEGFVLHLWKICLTERV